jgi:tetratricopeptide (TPR) repeat protein
MRWLMTEYILKGVYLGLLVFVGLKLPQTDWWPAIGKVALCTLGGLLLFLGVAAVRKLFEGYRIRGRLLPFLLFLVLENATLVYAGVLLGMTAGVFWMRFIADLGTLDVSDPAFWQRVQTDVEGNQEYWVIVGGAVLGYVFYSLRQTQAKSRIWFGLVMAICLVVGGSALLDRNDPPLLTGLQQLQVAVLLLLGLPIFYLLTLCGYAEESEIEFAALCAGLCLSLGVVSKQINTTSAFGAGSGGSQSVALGLPLVLYFVYAWRVMPGLRVFKYVLRGVGYANVGRWRMALLNLNRALQLDPRNTLAREQMWSIHRKMDLNLVANDPDTLAQVNFEFCLERVAWLLLHTPPSAEQVIEAHNLLDLVATQRPALLPRCYYWRTVALLHQKRLDEATVQLEAVLTAPGGPTENPHRWAVLVPAWHLALFLHPQMQQRVGFPLIGQPGRRMEAIAAAEWLLAKSGAQIGRDPAAPKPKPKSLLGVLGRKVQEQVVQAPPPPDPAAWDLKRMLYTDLQEGDYYGACPVGKPPELFDHAYARELGLALIKDADRWQRGAEYLRIAANGLPLEAPALYVQIAKAHERAGNIDAVYANYELAKQAGRAAGPKALKTEDRHMFYAVVKVLAEDAINRDDTDAALENYHLYTEYERSGVETYRQLAALYEKKKDAWAALRCCEQGVQYDRTDKDLQARRDRYYYSVTPDELAERWETVKKWFDTAYCLQKARWLLDQPGDADLIDWASHLLDLAQKAQPASLMIKLLRARVLRRRGETDKALVLLEELRTGKPEKFASEDDSEAWFSTCRLLGDLYLNENPQRAIECLMDFRQSPKSGADTSYKLGVAYENLGDYARAAKWYEQVIVYDSHPLTPDARDRLYRLKQGAQQA